MQVLKEFKKFINKGNVVDLAVVAFVGTANREVSAPETKPCSECLVPRAARRGRAYTSALAALPLLLFAAPAFAQGTPSFTYAKPDEVKPGAPPPPPVEWKASVKGGILFTTGNSETTNGTLALSVSRKESANRFALDASMAYGRSNILVPDVSTTDPTMITGFHTTEVTTTNNWLTKARYDRFFTANNSGYATGLAGADKIAGKSFAGGGQVGYSRQLVKDDVHTIVSELGYDFSYERYVQQPMRTLDPVTIQSARLFIGETLKLSPASVANASVEALFNLNREDKALNVNTAMPGVSAFHDTRVAGKVGLTTTLFARLSIAFNFTLRYDQNPAPRPIPPGTAPGLVYGTGFVPFSDKVDTLAEALLIYTFI